MRSPLSASQIRKTGLPATHAAISGVALNDEMGGLHAAVVSANGEVPVRRPTPPNPEENTPPEEFYTEPSVIIPQRSMHTTVLRSQRGGGAIIVHDDPMLEDGYIQIITQNGSVVQIDQGGTIFISSRSNIVQAADTSSFERVSEDKVTTVGRNWNLTIDGGNGNMHIQGDLNVECENFNVTARAKTVINSAEGIEMRGAKISMEAHLDNVDIIGRNVKVGAGESLSLNSVGSTYISTDSQLNLNAANEAFLTGSDTHILASGTLFATGSGDVQLNAPVVYIDDIVRMAEAGAGEAQAASPGVLPVTAEMTDSPDRRPRTPRDESGNDRLVSGVYSTGYGISPAGTDSTEDGESTRTV